MEYIVDSNETIALKCAQDIATKFVTSFLALFYIISPYQEMKNSAHDVPHYEVILTPFIGLLVLIEAALRYFQGIEMFRFADIVTNAVSAILFTLERVFLLSWSIVIMYWMHNNYAIIDLPLNSIFTWITSLLLVDFTYYWVHRSFHEINILWASHQYHHMPEDLHIFTFRETLVDMFLNVILPLPLAFIIPPPIMMVQVQFNFVYQAWLHNSVIGKLGYIEYIFGTPSQHRVHHGKNPYCIDKNYGTFLMIWDRILGTHATEKEEVFFGIVSPTPKTYDLMTLQFAPYLGVWQKFQKVEGFWNKMSAFFKGPGWQPGKPRLGLISDVPEPDPNAPKYSYDPYISVWKNWYTGVHGILTILGFYLLADHPYLRFSPEKGIIALVYIIFVLTSFGTIFDNRKYAPFVELLRCLAYFTFDYFLIAPVNWQLGKTMYLLLDIFLWSIRVLHMFSIMFWLLYCAMSYRNNRSNKGSDCVILLNNNKVECDPSPNSRLKTFGLLFALTLMTISFTIAVMARLDSCHIMFNNIPLDKLLSGLINNVFCSFYSVY